MNSGASLGRRRSPDPPRPGPAREGAQGPWGLASARPPALPFPVLAEALPERLEAKPRANLQSSRRAARSRAGAVFITPFQITNHIFFSPASVLN